MTVSELALWLWLRYKLMTWCHASENAPQQLHIEMITSLTDLSEKEKNKTKQSEREHKDQHFSKRGSAFSHRHRPFCPEQGNAGQRWCATVRATTCCSRTQTYLNWSFKIFTLQGIKTDIIKKKRLATVTTASFNTTTFYTNTKINKQYQIPA